MRRNFIILIVILGAIFTLALNFNTSNNIENNSYANLIRFHVIANSDNNKDQELKMRIRDVLLDIIEPQLTNIISIEDAENYLSNNLSNFSKIAQQEIKKIGYDYTVTAVLDWETYPTRAYGEIIFPAGNYRSLRIIIGEGKGANWWCVLFPPLCFVDITNNIVKNTDYEVSKILEPIETTEKAIDKENKNNIKIKVKIWEVFKQLFI